MAEIPLNNPTPGAPVGAEPPMKKSTGKVQPKKETVRINLPPKPTAAPTIKLPTLPPGGPTGPAGMPAPVAAPRRAAAAPVAQQPVPAPAAAPRRAPAITAAPTISPMDKILTIAAAVLAVVAVGTTVWMMLMLNSAITQ